MAVNQMQLMQEAMRPGQAQTEKRYMMMSVMSGTAGSQTPLLQHFANDPEIARLELDVDGVVGGIKAVFCRMLMCVPFIPHQLVCAVPCTLFGCVIPKVKAGVRAHRLILREHSILYEVDPYHQSVQAGNFCQLAIRPCVVELLQQGKTMPIQEVFPLSDIASAKTEPCRLQQCGMKIAPDTFVVRSKSQMHMHAAAAIDAPKNGDAFAAQIMAQAAKCAGDTLPPALDAAYKARLGGGMGVMMQQGMAAGMAGMGGGMGGMNMQQQQMMMMQRQQMGMQGGGAPMGMQMGAMGMGNQAMGAGGVVPTAPAAIPMAVPMGGGGMGGTGGNAML